MNLRPLTCLAFGCFALAVNATSAAHTPRGPSTSPSDASLRVLGASAVAASAVPALTTLAVGQSTAAVIRGVERVGEDVLLHVGLSEAHDMLLPLRVSARAAELAGAAPGVALIITAHATGFIVGCNGRALGFLPRAQSRGLLHDERITTP